jgi:hypothetical protein
VARKRPCPVLSLAVEASAILQAMEAIELDKSDKFPTQSEMQSKALQDRLDAIKEQAGFQRPGSVDGAAFLIMMAGAEADVLFSSEFASECERERTERRFARCLELGLSYIRAGCTAADKWKWAQEYFHNDDALQASFLAAGLRRQ